MILNMGCGGTCFGDVNIDVNKKVFNLKEKKVFLQCDAHHLPFKSNCFSQIYSIDVLEHVDSPANYLREAKRVLINQGFLMLGTPNGMRVLNFLFIIKHGFYIPHQDHISLWGRIELENLVKRIGFSCFVVFPYTYGDTKHNFIANLFLELLSWRKDLSDRQLVVLAKK